MNLLKRFRPKFNFNKSFLIKTGILTAIASYLFFAPSVANAGKKTKHHPKAKHTRETLMQKRMQKAFEEYQKEVTEINRKYQEELEKMNIKYGAGKNDQAALNDKGQAKTEPVESKTPSSGKIYFPQEDNKETKAKRFLDAGKAKAFLDKNYSGTVSKGRCVRAVFDALKAAGLWDLRHAGSPSGYGAALKEIGYVEIDPSSEGIKNLDVVIVDPLRGRKPNKRGGGHMEVCLEGNNGNIEYRSDHRQKSIDPRPGKYLEQDVAFRVYRPSTEYFVLTQNIETETTYATASADKEKPTRSQRSQWRHQSRKLGHHLASLSRR